jgi:hypothetical protein
MTNRSAGSCPLIADPDDAGARVGPAACAAPQSSAPGSRAGQPTSARTASNRERSSGSQGGPLALRCLAVVAVGLVGLGVFHDPGNVVDERLLVPGPPRRWKPISTPPLTPAAVMTRPTYPTRPGTWQAGAMLASRTK